MLVTIGTQPCDNVNVTTADWTALVCLAPQGPGTGDVQLVVHVAGSGSGAYRFLYDAPTVTGVAPSPCSSNDTCLVVVQGRNLGLKTAPDPDVYIGESLSRLCPRDSRQKQAGQGRATAPGIRDGGSKG